MCAAYSALRWAPPTVPGWGGVEVSIVGLPLSSLPPSSKARTPVFLFPHWRGSGETLSHGTLLFPNQEMGEDVFYLSNKEKESV